MFPHLRGGGQIDFGVDLMVLALVLALASASHFLVCTISYELVVTFLPNFHGYIIGT